MDTWKLQLSASYNRLMHSEGRGTDIKRVKEAVSYKNGPSVGT